ncbi:MAG: cysteine hydrolase [Clostridium sp.]|nr:cysteine hydrolase [Clostridium sp.]
MKKIERNDFISKSSVVLGSILDQINNLPILNIKDLDPDRTVMVIIDMINGFTREGALSSARSEAVIPHICALGKICEKRGIRKLAFADNHTSKSPEFNSYPVHCLAGTTETEIVDEIKDIGGYERINKNSTNAFVEEEFSKWLLRNNHINTFIVTGVCTDICIQQFAITLKAYFNMKDNGEARVIVPVDAIDTFDLDLHDADLMNVMAIYSMMGNGIEAVAGIRE